MRQELLIVGIDPGITSAYALLDGNGNLVKMRSSKELSLNSLLAEITAEGKVLVIGTDVKRIPGLIGKFSARVGAKILTPEEDMKVGFKERITESYNPRDDHQRDALAAALQAFKEIHPTLRKVDDSLRRMGKERLSNEVKVMAIRGMNIPNALSVLEKKEDPGVIRKKRVKTAFKKPSRLVEENSCLKKQNRRLETKVNYLDNKVRQLLKKVGVMSEQKADAIIVFKNKKIDFLNRRGDKSRKEIARLQRELKKTTDLLGETRGKIVAKKLKTLGWEEVSGVVKEGDSVVVDDVNSFSNRSLEELRKKVSYIIYRKRPAKELLKLGFSFINAANIDMKETASFALIDKESLERERKKKDILSTILEEYQEERQAIV